MANPSRFAGQYNAAEYAYGRPGINVPALTIDGPVASGANSATVAFGYTATSDGQTFYPLNTNAPVTVGSGANAETVTPSAVSATNGAYDAMNFTATFSNAHGRGDPVMSGTYGLQEALNAASAAGGGVVVLDNRWTKLGGTTTMLAAATIASTVTVSDQRSGTVAQLNTVSIALTNANLIALNATPITVLAAQGAGTLIEPISAILDLKFGVAAFAGGSTVALQLGAAVVSATIATTVFTSFSADQSIKVAGVLPVTANSGILNTALTVKASGSEYTNASGGVSTAILHVTYVVHHGL